MTSLRDRAAMLPLEPLVVLALVLLAALTRLPGLDERGRWDADQGHDMLVLRALVTEGSVPLLGPRTSIGTFHHGAAYYDILAPAAIVSGADPVAVTGWIALLGIGAVLATWWLARLTGGPLAGALAGLLAAVSPAGIDESTFIWNPNLVPVAAALALAGMLRARQTGRDRWWLLAAAGAMVTMQAHVLGAVILPPMVVAWAMELRRRRRAGMPARPLLNAGAGALLILAAGFVPLAIHELQTGFVETRAILDYLTGGGRGASADLATRIGLVGWRSVAWPLVGLVTDRPLLSAVATVVAAGLAAVATMRGRAADRAAVRWLLATLAWSAVALAVFAPSLATVTPGLPNDHYHAFLDPLVLVLAGVGLARLASVGGRAGAADARVMTVRLATGRLAAVRLATGGLATGRLATGRLATGRLAAGVLTVVLVAAGVSAWPPRVADDGGWRLVDEAAARVARTVDGSTVELDGIPPFKSADALRFPLLRRGVSLLPADPASDGPPDGAPDGNTGAGGAAGAGTATVLVCDPLFEEVVGSPCGGPAEDAWLAADAGRSGLRLVDRFGAGPRRVVSVYAAGQP